MRSVVLFLGCALLVVGCSSDTGSTPLSVDGTWVFQVINSGCPEVIGMVNGDDGLQVEVFEVRQTGQQVAAQFVDNGGNNCTLTGTYAPDEFRGTVTVEESEGRTLILSAEGIARQFGNTRQVDGWLRVELDTFGDCEGAIVEFCAVIGGEIPDQTFEICPPVDIVFLMDTSGSMDDEAEALCSAIANVEASLRAQGLDEIRVTLWGIIESGAEANARKTQDNTEEAMENELPIPPPVTAYQCLTSSVLEELGETVPGTPFEGIPGNDRNGPELILDDSEDWGPGATIVAERFAWMPGAIRIVSTISDEGIEDGGANDPGECTPGASNSELPKHEAAVQNLIMVADDNGVIVSPIITFSEDRLDCVFEFAQDVADGTGGVALEAVNATTTASVLTNFIFNIVQAACETVSVTDPPENLTYPTNQVICTVGDPLSPTLSPTSTGGPVSSYEIGSGTLPQGITMDSRTGVISGSCDAVQPEICVQIIARNADGTDDFTICFTVNPPQTLTDEEVIAQCDNITLLFAVDTSGSMADDATALDATIQALVTRLQNLGATVQFEVFGITEAGDDAVTRINGMFMAVQELVNQFSPIPITVPLLPANTFSNITQTVVDRFGNGVPLRGVHAADPNFAVPIDSAPPTVIIPGVLFNFSFESWASATAILSEEYPFITGTVPIIIPMSDECGEEGNSGENFAPLGVAGPTIFLADRGDCDQSDTDAVSNAILVAQDNGVIVSPIQAFLFDALSQALGEPAVGFHPQVAADMDRIANATGGRRFPITDPGAEMADALFDLVVAACRERLESPNFTGGG